MRRSSGVRPAGAALLLACLLAGCGPGVEPAFVAGPSAPFSFGPSWGGMRPEVPSEVLTVQRIRALDVPPPPPLLPQEGNVWPPPEGPRATLANPDEALRGLPPRGSSGLDLPPLDFSSPAAAAPRLPEPPRPLALPAPPREDGRVIPTPTGPRVTTGGTERVQGTISPTGRPGTAIRDGATTTLIEPGRPPQVVPTPR